MSSTVRSIARVSLVSVGNETRSTRLTHGGVIRDRTAPIPRPVNPRPARAASMKAPWDLVRLGPVMERGIGRPEVVVGLIDGPVAIDHPDLARESVREITGHGGSCTRPRSAACLHGTFVAGILSARRGTAAPALCPGCTLVVRPIFSEADGKNLQLPVATAADLAAALTDCMDAGARILNLSASLAQASPRDERDLQAVLDCARQRGVIVVAAAGNQASVGGSVITRHPWVVPVVGYTRYGRPMSQSNLGAAIGRNGLGGPGEGVTSLRPAGQPITSQGTSVAAPFVAGAFALLLSAFPRATGAQVRWASTWPAASRRRTVVPPLLDGWAGYQVLSTVYSRR
jgi:subtilisin family serine protease